MDSPMPHRFALRVYYEDTDLAGIVYHANYLRFIERGRTEALADLGVDQARLKAETGVVLAVRRVEAEFLAPGVFQDRLEVTTGLRGLSGARIDLVQGVWRGGMLLMRAEVRIVALGDGLRAVRVPGPVQAALAQMASADDAV